ncbi:MAG: carbon monoxide dehydrogenase subunit G [Alteromonas macleodii]|jgi:carbon monoxide dehydrogenase subunit G
MELIGTRIIAADLTAVWAHLNNPETLQASIPGCEELTGTPETGFEAVVKQKVGPVKATFKGVVTLENVNAPQSCRIVGEGKGGVAGFAKGTANVTLTEIKGGTELSFNVDAKVGGKLAQLGSRIVGGFAKKMADQFFESFQSIVENKAPTDN